MELKFEVNPDWPHTVEVFDMWGITMVRTGRRVPEDVCYSCGRSDEVDEELTIGEAISEGVLVLTDKTGDKQVAKCTFIKSWVGLCGEPGVVQRNSLPRCSTHADETCSRVRCKNPATHDCDATIGPMVCGRPWCDEHKCGGH